MSYFHYWGKVASNGSYHLLPYHCLDVAACGEVLLEANPRLLLRLSEALEMKEIEAKQLLLYFLALHDFGKFSQSFQALDKTVASILRPNAAEAPPYTIRHDTLGKEWWSELASYPADHFDKVETQCLANAIFGHHGVPPLATKEGEALSKFDAHNRDSAAVLENEFLTLFQPVWPDRVSEKKIKAVSWILAGWAVLADWLGSNAEVFDFKQDISELDAYYGQSLIRARRFIEESGLFAPEVEPRRFDSLFPGYKPTHLQEWSDTVAIPDEPSLFILEDSTGSGKTEAALTLAARIMNERGFSGLFVALPTMATSNQMFERTLSMYHSLYSSESKPSIVLAHGQRRLSERFRNNVVVDIATGDRRAYDSRGKDVSAAGFCAEWIADRSKKSLLADVGVGTVDQLLLSVLPSRHQSLRMLGIINKVIIIDEVHAYDEYMNRILENLLRFAYQEGLYVILLSATLTRNQKQRLVDTYTGEELQQDSFPLATIASPSETTETPFEADPAKNRTYSVRRLKDEESALGLVKDHAEQGRCVCWIRNTVDDAIRAYDSLKTHGVDVELFHARFAASDRQAIEERSLARYGKSSTPALRRGGVLVATQVVEQSLDVDFDEMVSDIAPIDLLIQRIGRMRRHVRDKDGTYLGPDHTDERGEAWINILCPDPSIVEGPEWFSGMFPGGAAVYPAVDVIWRTARDLFSREQLVLPSQSRELVEEAYGESPVPEVLDQKADQAMAKDFTKSNMGRLNSLSLKSGYESFGMDNWRPEIKTPTRYQERPTYRVRLAVTDGESIKPLCSHPAFPWEMSEVGLSENLLGESIDAKEEEAALALMPDEGRWARVIVLHQRNGQLISRRQTNQKEFTLSYSANRGLTKMEEE